MFGWSAAWSFVCLDWRASCPAQELPGARPLVLWAVMIQFTPNSWNPRLLRGLRFCVCWFLDSYDVVASVNESTPV